VWQRGRGSQFYPKIAWRHLWTSRKVKYSRLVFPSNTPVCERHLPASQQTLWRQVHICQAGNYANTLQRGSLHTVPLRPENSAPDQLTPGNGHTSPTQTQFLLIRNSRIYFFYHSFVEIKIDMSKKVNSWLPEVILVSNANNSIISLHDVIFQTSGRQANSRQKHDLIYTHVW